LILYIDLKSQRVLGRPVRSTYFFLKSSQISIDHALYIDHALWNARSNTLPY